jgi:hypothetical protein
MNILKEIKNAALYGLANPEPPNRWDAFTDQEIHVLTQCINDTFLEDSANFPTMRCLLDEVMNEHERRLA